MFSAGNVESNVINVAKDLCSYVMAVTQKSSEKFRYTFVSKLQKLAIGVVENLFRANDVLVSKQDLQSQKERLNYQQAAMTDLKLLGYMAQISLEQNCIRSKQYEQIENGVVYCQNLLRDWMSSDTKKSQPWFSN